MSRPLVLAAGGVVWRGDAEDPELAVVHRPAYDDWSLPKGKAKPGEHLLVTALREVAEETGQQAVIGPLLTTVEAYDPTANAWTPRTWAPTARWALGLAGAGNGRLYRARRYGDLPEVVRLAVRELFRG